ncbi:MAG: cadmium-translocating P-type ATPase [Actinobacteria bacterium]|nr:cadmium-translocating P-type ATPase [Actinomycetota bacterium]
MTPPVVVEIPASAAGDCASCDERLREGLADHPGVDLVTTPDGGRDVLAVRIDPDVCSTDCLTAAVDELRRDLGETYAHETTRIEGMDCSSCVQTIERAVARIDGVTDIAVNLTASTMRVEYRPGVVAFDRVRDTVTRLGYRVDAPGEEPSNVGRRSRMTPWAGTAAASVLLALALTIDFATSLTAIPLYLAAILVGGVPVARSGVSALIATRRPTIKLLMAIATVGATAIGAWVEAALVVVLFSIGELLESLAVDRARRELSGLVSLTPQTARVMRTTGRGEVEETEVPLTEIHIGDVVIVRPGDRIPVDGTVTGGSSTVDQAPITGESTPVDRAIGDTVFAGTRNVHGRLVVTVSTAPGDTTLERIAKLVIEAQAQKSPSERWVDAFSRWYTPAVIGVAALVAAIPPLFGVPFAEAFYSALALLILACPCALVISTPVAIVSALGRASAAGVLVKGGAHLEVAAGIDTVAFDKTGTLTEGRPSVAAVFAPDGGEDVVVTLAAAVEEGSEHPLARAITQHARSRGLSITPVEDFLALPGLGARGSVDGREITVGDTRLFGALPASVDTAIERMRAAGQTAVVVAVDAEPVGAIGIADTIRSASQAAVGDLRRLGIERIVLLTGDNELTARGVAAHVGIDDVRASLLPAEKSAAVADLGGSVAMVGDGINDAPALAASDLGIAMGTAGSDAAIEVADAAIMGDDPRNVAGLIGLGRWTKAVVRQNIAFSLGTKAIAVGVLAVGALPLWGAVVADVGASLIVVSNSLRLIRGRPSGTSRDLPLLQPFRLDSSPPSDSSASAPPAPQDDHCADACCSTGAEIDVAASTRGAP